MGLSVGAWALLASIGSTAYSVYESEEAKGDAEDQARLAEQQARLQKRQEEIRARRQARIRQAQIAAAAGDAGISGSIVEGPTAGIGTSLQTGLDLLEKQTELQVQEIGKGLESTKAALTSQQIKGISSSVGSALNLAKTSSFTAEVDQPDLEVE